MNKSLVLIVCLITFLFVAHTDVYASDKGSVDLEKIDSQIEKALKIFHIPGAAIGVVVKGKTVLAKGYGNQGPLLE